MKESVRITNSFLSSSFTPASSRSLSTLKDGYLSLTVDSESKVSIVFVDYL